MATLVPAVQLSTEGPIVSRLSWGMMRLSDWNITRSELADKIDECIGLGITTFDHADIYGDGECERLFGDVLADNPGLRRQIQLVTKCGVKPARGRKGIKTYDTSYRYIVESAERSLRRLKTDHIDLFLIHRPDPLMDVDQTAAALALLRRSGKIVHAGVSNFPPDQFALLGSRLDFALVTNQVEVSVIQLEAFLNGTLAMCQERRILPMVWGPLGRGRIFTEQTTMIRRVCDALAHVATELGTRSLQDVALAWLLFHPVGMVPVLGTGDARRLHAAAGCFEVRLSRRQWFAIWQAATGVELP